MTSTNPSNEHPTLIDALLADQRELSAVGRFARQHENHELPGQAKYYRDLIPLTAPKPGEQYAFEVDLDRCSGCKACVTACHSLNGLDEEETWRDVGLLFSDDWRAPYQATVTTACHHCVDPGCLSGCPVLAYDKDPVTGIVRHLDDQCIGCQYCIMKCPYDVPKYSARRGIVRKCDMCSSRLRHGEAPSCVQACPSQAIRITVVQQNVILNQFRGKIGNPVPQAIPSNEFLPTSPKPSTTLPTTRYKSSKPLPANLLAGDHARITPSHSHMPLVFMLVLSQLAVGLSIGNAFIPSASWLSLSTVLVGMWALSVGTFHLGQPLKAWKAFLGWRTSWFSREIIAFGIFVPCAIITFALSWSSASILFSQVFAFATAFAGLFAVACSAMIYVDTRREFWNATQSFTRFFGTTFLLGSLGISLGALLFHKVGSHYLKPAVLAICVASAFKLIFENRIYRHLVDEQTPLLSPLNKTALLLANELGLLARLRIFCGVLGGMVLPLYCLLQSSSGINPNGILIAGMVILCLAGELLERYLFFTAVAPAKMPGGAS